MNVSLNASNRLKVAKITEKCTMTNKMTVVYDDSKKDKESK